MTKKLEEKLNLPNVKAEFSKVDKKDKEKKFNENIVGKNLDPKTQEALKKRMQNLIKLPPLCPK